MVRVIARGLLADVLAIIADKLARASEIVRPARVVTDADDGGDAAPAVVAPAAMSMVDRPAPKEKPVERAAPLVGSLDWRAQQRMGGKW